MPKKKIDPKKKNGLHFQQDKKTGKWDFYYCWSGKLIFGSKARGSQEYNRLSTAADSINRAVDRLSNETITCPSYVHYADGRIE